MSFRRASDINEAAIPLRNPGYPSGREEDAISLTWKELAKIEPRLGTLKHAVLGIDSTDEPNFCANRIWYAQLKPRLKKLVGWYSTSPDSRLRTETAYALAYRHLYDLLPGCRDCSC